jgi:hypothetical protein
MVLQCGWVLWNEYWYRRAVLVLVEAGLMEEGKRMGLREIWGNFWRKVGGKKEGKVEAVEMV